MKKETRRLVTMIIAGILAVVTVLSLVLPAIA